MENNKSPAPVHQLVGQLRELLERGTPGPWHDSHMEWDESGRVIMAGGRDRIKVNWNGGTWRKQCEADAALIVAVINTLPALLDVVEAAELVCGLHADDREADHLLGCLMSKLDALPNAKDDPAGVPPSPHV